MVTKVNDNLNKVNRFNLHLYACTLPFPKQLKYPNKMTCGAKITFGLLRNLILGTN